MSYVKGISFQKYQKYSIAISVQKESRDPVHLNVWYQDADSFQHTKQSGLSPQGIIPEMEVIEHNSVSMVKWSGAYHDWRRISTNSAPSIRKSRDDAR